MLSQSWLIPLFESPVLICWYVPFKGLLSQH
jgi:hypothetical protein